MDSATQIILNVIGGAITVGLIELGKFVASKLKLRKFKDSVSVNTKRWGEAIKEPEPRTMIE